MSKKQLPVVPAKLEKIVGGGQTLATLEDGRKLFAWGGLPGEQVSVQITKKKARLLEGVVIDHESASDERIEPRDPDSYLSTSPWQIMDFAAEQRYKSALVEEAFELHNIVLPNPIEMYSDETIYGYRNKVEFSWYWDKETETLDLAFFRRGSHGKLPVQGTSLAHPHINEAARQIRDLIRARGDIGGFDLKTLLIRCNRAGDVVAQLYAKNVLKPFDEQALSAIDHLIGFELIQSDPRSPASVITERIQAWGETTLSDTLLDVNFSYAVEGFFQINLPVYEQALRDMQKWVEPDKPTLDMYSGVGTIGLTIGTEETTLVEVNEFAVREMQANIKRLQRSNTTAVLSASEMAVEHISAETCLILDPPRAGLHADVIQRILETKPTRIIYLSCNPVTQARDVALLGETYGIRHHTGYNFFPRTPHIEHLVILDLK